MSADYANATINNLASKGNAKNVQDMIGTTTALRANSAQMQNGHIGAAQAAAAVTPVERATQIAANATPAIKNDASALAWDVTTGLWIAGV